MIRTTIVALGALALTMTTASVVRAEGIHRLSVVNDSGAPMEIYAEDASGRLHAVTHLKAGEVKTIEADLETVDGGRVRLHARPTDSVDRFSTWGDKEIVTHALRMSSNDTAIFWIAPVLGESSVELRPS